MRTTSTRRTVSPGAITGTIITGVLALTAAACGSSTSPAPATSPSHHAMASHSMAAHPMASHPMAESAPFGSDCGMVPATGMGSFHGMSMDPFAIAAANNPLLTTLAADIKTAGLTAELDSMHTLTVFAPANTAFSELPASTMTMMHSQAELAKILKFHVVSGHITPAQLASGKTLTTLEGSALTPSKMGAVYEVDNASIICGNIQTANATVYVVNKVLVPMH